MDQRQTLTYIKSLLRSRGLIPKAKMGQNFLIDLNLLDFVAKTAELDRKDCVLEVGTGTGALTARMAVEAGAVFTVELDRDFFELAGPHLAVHHNVRRLMGDALAGKNELNPHLVEGWDATAQEFGLKRFKLCANLPYAIATPLITNLLLTGRSIESMTAMVQWEVAERMAAQPDTKDYGALAVLLGSTCQVQIVRRIAPTNFWPRPDVDSAVVLIQPDPSKIRAIPDLMRWRAFLRDLYTQRRKGLRQALSGWPRGRRDKKEVDATLAEMNIDGSRRAESLSIADHLRLCERFG